MPFENFYKESDKANRLWWKCVGAGILLFAGYWVLGLLFLPTFESDVKPDEALLRTERLRRVKELCESVPKPELFNFLTETLPEHNDSMTIVDYNYRSKRSFDEVMPLFLVWFDSNGWERLTNKTLDGSLYQSDREAIYYKYSSTISIIHYDLESRPDYLEYPKDFPNYVIQCRENALRIYD